MRYLLFLFMLTWLFCSCEKEEKPITLPPKPNDSLALVQVNLGEHYEEQVFINFLDSDFIKASIKNSAWDIAFECTPESPRIFMNGGKGVFIGVLGYKNFQSNVNINQVNWSWDESSGADSIVLKSWCNPFNHQSLDSVYIIDRGQDAEPGKRYYQFKIATVAFGVYSIEAADLKGKPEFKTVVAKDYFKNLVYLDFGQGKFLNFEPFADNWHLCFLRTRWVYYEFKPPLIYTVTGIQINSRLFSVAIDSTLNFEHIRKQDVEPMKYSSKRDVMGFDWKVYDFNQGKYITRKYVNYIIRTKGPQTKYYKLRFTDYYSKRGVKGSPKFEVAAIH